MKGKRGEIRGVPFYFDNDDSWEEYKEPLLTDEEKSMLIAICKLKDYRVSAISVGFDSISNTKYLNLQRKEYRKSSLNYDYDMFLNIDIRYFKGIESHKLYSLEELGID